MADKNPFANVGLGMFGSEGAAGGLGQDILSGLTAYGIDKSGLKDYLNSKGISKNATGQWSYVTPAVPPTPNYSATSEAEDASFAAPVVPPATQSVAPAAPVQTPPSSGVGNKILDNEWHGHDQSDQDNQNKFAMQSASQFVPTMGYNPAYASDKLKQFAQFSMMG